MSALQTAPVSLPVASSAAHFAHARSLFEDAKRLYVRVSVEVRQRRRRYALEWR